MGLFLRGFGTGSRSGWLGRWPVPVLFILLLAAGGPALAQAPLSSEDFPARDRGEGPYDRLVIDGGFLIDGLGGPTEGPTVITVEKDRITDIRIKRPGEGPVAAPVGGTTRVVDAAGQYVLPGFINAHAHIHSVKGGQGGWGGSVPADYVAKLWLAHGITSVREVGNGRSMDWVMEVTRRAASHEITAPRIYPHIRFGSEPAGSKVTTPQQARDFMRRVAAAGAHGVKFFGAPPRILGAAFDEAKELGLRTTMHHAQTAVVEANVLTTSGLGLNAMEHWYGLPEALFDDRIVQDYSPDYIYQDEQDRFGEAGGLWAQAAGPGSERWRLVMGTLLERDFHIIPTFTIYIANRDWMRARRAEWHDDYTLPQLWDFFRPSLEAHGSYWFDWTLDRELAWADNFRRWMVFINAYKNRGGLVGVGEDAGYIYSTYGFGLIREMELLREAGFHPLEVIRAATIVNARILGVATEIGSVEIGKKADLVVVPENPLQNFKTLYATGHLRMDRASGAVERVGGVGLTIRDGIVYDAAQLREDIKAMVRTAKEKRGLPPGPMPIATR
ncbi:MAG: amidohydrolase family protein [Alphaproteobacteria bacterium]